LRREDEEQKTEENCDKKTNSPPQISPPNNERNSEREGAPWPGRCDRVPSGLAASQRDFPRRFLEWLSRSMQTSDEFTEPRGPRDTLRAAPEEQSGSRRPRPSGGHNPGLIFPLDKQFPLPPASRQAPF